MSFRRSDLQEAFFVPGTHAFRRAWLPEPTTKVGPERRGLRHRRPARRGAGTGLLRRAANTLLQPGDLIYVRARASGQGQGGASAAAVHMALLMVRAGPRGSVAVRLVQDFGRSGRARRGHPDSDRFAGGGHGGAAVAQARPRPSARQPEQEKWCDVDDVGQLKRHACEIDPGFRCRAARGARRVQGIFGHFLFSADFPGAGECTPVRHFCITMVQMCAIP